MPRFIMQPSNCCARIPGATVAGGAVVWHSHVWEFSHLAIVQKVTKFVKFVRMFGDLFSYIVAVKLFTAVFIYQIHTYVYMYIFPHIFVWGPCFCLCTPVRSSCLLLPPAAAAVSHTQLTQLSHTHNLLTHNSLTHTQLSHTHTTYSHATYSTYSHTTLTHTQLTHTQLTHTLDKNGSLYDPAGTESWRFWCNWTNSKWPKVIPDCDNSAANCVILWLGF